MLKKEVADLVRKAVISAEPEIDLEKSVTIGDIQSCRLPRATVHSRCFELTIDGEVFSVHVMKNRDRS